MTCQLKPTQILLHKHFLTLTLTLTLLDTNCKPLFLLPSCCQWTENYDDDTENTAVDSRQEYDDELGGDCAAGTLIPCVDSSTTVQTVTAATAQHSHKLLAVTY